MDVSDFHQGAWIKAGYLAGDAYDEWFRKAYAAMILAMRRDGFAGTRLPRELIEDRIPFGLGATNGPPYAPDVGE
jgi:hypothetical protein